MTTRDRKRPRRCSAKCARMPTCSSDLNKEQASIDPTCSFPPRNQTCSQRASKKRSWERGGCSAPGPPTLRTTTHSTAPTSKTKRTTWGCSSRRAMLTSCCTAGTSRGSSSQNPNAPAIKAMKASTRNRCRRCWSFSCRAQS